MMELVKTHFFNLILHVRRVTQVQIDTSRFGVKCPDLIGDAGGQYMFFLYLFYRLRLSKVSQSVSNKSYLILSYLFLEFITENVPNAGRREGVPNQAIMSQFPKRLGRVGDRKIWDNVTKYIFFLFLIWPCWWSWHVFSVIVS